MHKDELALHLWLHCQQSYRIFLSLQLPTAMPFIAGTCPREWGPSLVMGALSVVTGWLRCLSDLLWVSPSSFLLHESAVCTELSRLSPRPGDNQGPCQVHHPKAALQWLSTQPPGTRWPANHMERAWHWDMLEEG